MQNTTSGLVWQESISSLNDEKFFEVMNLYLGKIKTPYNRQRLIEQLVSFLKTEENYKSIISLLDEFDVKILTAIAYIPNVTEEILLSFFGTDYSLVEIVGELSNLQERLIIFYQQDSYSNKKFIRFNPFLQDKIEPFINLNKILISEKVSFYSMEDSFYVSPQLICAIISYVKSKGCSFKNDGTLKKGDLNRISEIFSGHEKCIETLIRSFLNLNLFVEGEKSFVVDSERFEMFAKLPFNFQVALICTAACSRFGREGLKKEAQLFLDVLSSIPDSGYSISTITKLAFLTSPVSSSSNSKSRFSRILEAAKQENSLISENSGPVIEKMVDSAILFGFLQHLGKTEDGVEIYSVNKSINSENLLQKGQSKNVLNIDSTYTVSLMPGLSLKELLPLTDFISIKLFGIVSEYEITRQSVSNAFDKGWNPESIFKTLTQFCSYEVPQNLKISVEDWYNSFLSARIYQGYVLKVTDTNISYIENNPNIRKYIKEKLAEGIYLLNVPVTEDITPFIEASGLDFMGKIKESSFISEKMNFPLLNPGRSVIFAEKDSAAAETNFTGANELLTQLKNHLQTMEIDANQRESLEYRIHNRLILNTKHLQSTSVRSEILEAEGMDYSGKIFLLDASLKNGDKVELTLPLPTGKEGYFKIIGKPLSITKQMADAYLKLQLFPDGEIQTLTVSRITHLRRLRF